MDHSLVIFDASSGLTVLILKESSMMTLMNLSLKGEEGPFLSCRQETEMKTLCRLINLINVQRQFKLTIISIITKYLVSFTPFVDDNNEQPEHWAWLLDIVNIITVWRQPEDFSYFHAITFDRQPADCRSDSNVC